MKCKSIDLDYDEEGKKIFLKFLGVGVEGAEERKAYDIINSMYKHPKTGGIIFVGGQSACERLSILQEFKITHVLNCTDSIKNYFESKPVGIVYLRKDMGSWWKDVNKTDESLVKFISPALEFIMQAILKGENVLIHCLAGAHRAGTMGIISLMFFASLHLKEAVPTAQRLRPVINPIGMFPQLLDKMQAAIDKKKFDDLKSKWLSTIE